MGKLRSWDDYVEEADRPPLELPLPDGGCFRLNYPTKRAIDILDRQREEKTATDDDFAITLLGEAEGCRLLELAASAPVGALQLMLGDAMTEWGLWRTNPFRKGDVEEETGNSSSSSG